MKNIKNPIISLYTKVGENIILLFEFIIPKGLFDPELCR